MAVQLNIARGFKAVCLLCVALVAAQHDHTIDKMEKVEPLPNPFGELMENFDLTGDGKLSLIEFEMLYDQVFSGDVASTADDPHGGHDHKRSLGRSSKRQEDHEDEDPYCPHAEDIMAEFEDGSGYLETEGLERASMSMLIMKGFNGCTLDDEDDDDEAPEAWAVWLASIFSVVIISCIGAVVVLVLPFASVRLAFDTLIAFAAGAIVGDAILHLIPNVLGVHGHSANDDGGEADLWEDVMGVMMMVSCGIVGFFALEKTIMLFSDGGEHGPQQETTSSSSKNEYSQETFDSSSDDLEERKDDSTSLEDLTLAHAKLRSYSSNKYVDLRSNVADKAKDVGVKVQKQLPMNERTQTAGRAKTCAALHFCVGNSPAGVKSFAWVNLLSDALHNLMDGIAIGAAFSVSWGTGIATAFAVLFHELPQELGDFAILLRAGLGPCVAMGLNFAVACLAILGAILGAAIGTNSEEGTRWILAFTAGGFLYVGLADMIPELQASEREWMSRRNFWKDPLGWDVVYRLLLPTVHLCGFIAGFMVMVMLTVLEEEFFVAFE